ncbi:hypothetical protein ACFYYH_20180 [Streptomyces sp. NPDC002018]|uniref:hypothetical protein n=1 Tax=Streptomyces sp. NPDC002018 TaxID=3364629 RepID=UPI0036CCC0E5
MIMKSGRDTGPAAGPASGKRIFDRLMLAAGTALVQNWVTDEFFERLRDARELRGFLLLAVVLAFITVPRDRKPDR